MPSNGRQTTIQLSAVTKRQIASLTKLGHGTQSEIIRVAIDRMHREEVAAQADAYCVQVGAISAVVWRWPLDGTWLWSATLDEENRNEGGYRTADEAEQDARHYLASYNAVNQPDTGKGES